MSIFVINSLFFGFSMFLMSILVLLKRWDELGRRWFYFSVFVTVWAIPNAFLIDNRTSYDMALLASRLSHASAAFIPATWLYFVCRFLEVKLQKLFWIAWPIAWFLMLTSSSPWFVPSLSSAKGYLHVTDAGYIFHLQTANFFVIVGCGFYMLAAHFFKERVIQRRKEIFALLFATAVGFLGGGSNFSIVYLRDNGFDLTLLLSLYPFLMAHAMIKHRVLDLEKIADVFQRERLAVIGTLTASINHEIRNPLYVIKGLAESYLENLKQGFYSDREEALQKSNEVIFKSMEQAQRAMEIMKRFALFAKERGKEETELEEIDLSRVLESILPLVQHELELDKIQLVREIPKDLPPLHADRRHIEEILFNLIVNACQAMKKGGQLTLQAEQRDSSVNIIVKDTGPGIPSDQLPKIFEPFYTTKETGTGLGLYITKQLVERNRGRITVESQPHKGTCFILDFPGEFKRPL